jgi:hypothetical protein
LPDCLLPAVSKSNSKGKKDTVRNPHEPAIRIWQRKEQDEEGDSSHPPDNCGLDRERTFAWPVSVLNAEISSNDTAGDSDNTSRDPANPSPHCSCAQFVILFAKQRLYIII